MYKNIAVIGSGGAIGAAFTRHVSELYPKAVVHAFSRGNGGLMQGNVITHTLDYNDEVSISEAAEMASRDAPLDMVFIATCLLHENDVAPEKSLKDISAKNFNKIITVNCLLPALLAKHFLPRINRHERSVFAVLSARVGSISDNRLGGWYSYRASKAALNMIIKTAAIETRRLNKKAVVIGLHPGTVDSNLSKPFLSRVAEDNLFSPEYAASCLLAIIDSITSNQTGRCLAWDGQEIAP